MKHIVELRKNFIMHSFFFFIECWTLYHSYGLTGLLEDNSLNNLKNPHCMLHVTIWAHKVRYMFNVWTFLKSYHNSYIGLHLDLWQKNVNIFLFHYIYFIEHIGEILNVVHWLPRTEKIRMDIISKSDEKDIINPFEIISVVFNEIYEKGINWRTFDIYGCK